MNNVFLQYFMDEVKLIFFWLNALLVLLYGCWMVETKTVGKITVYWS